MKYNTLLQQNINFVSWNYEEPLSNNSGTFLLTIIPRKGLENIQPFNRYNGKCSHSMNLTMCHLMFSWSSMWHHVALQMDNNIWGNLSCPSSRLKWVRKEAASLSKMAVSSYKTTKFHSWEDHNLNESYHLIWLSAIIKIGWTIFVPIIYIDNLILGHRDTLHMAQWTLMYKHDTFITTQDLTFSQQWLWEILFSAIQCHVVHCWSMPLWRYMFLLLSGWRWSQHIPSKCQ
jgi:hypothetical protein